MTDGADGSLMDSALEDLLREALAPLGPELLDDGVSFTFSGAPTDLPKRLLAAPPVGEAFGLRLFLIGRAPDRRALWGGLGRHPAKLQRFGRIQVAASHMKLSEQGEGIHDWLEMLLYECSPVREGETMPFGMLTIHRSLQAAGEDPTGWLRRVAAHIGTHQTLSVSISLPGGGWTSLSVPLKIGLRELQAEEPSTIDLLIRSAPAANATHVAALLEAAGCDPRLCATSLRSWATASGKKFRSAAELWLGRSEWGPTVIAGWLTDGKLSTAERKTLGEIQARLTPQTTPVSPLPEALLTGDLAKRILRPIEGMQVWEILGTILATWPHTFQCSPLALVRTACADHPDVLEEALGFRPPRLVMSDWDASHRRSNTLRLFTGWDPLPSNVLPLAWRVVFGTVADLRDAVRPVLAREVDFANRLHAALRDRQQAVRLAAANWIRQLGRAAPDGCETALTASLAQEKSDAPRAALMLALESIGVSADRFMDRAALVREAFAGLAKGIPEAISWLPLEQLPPLRWRDAEHDLEAAIPRWWVVQAVRLGKAEPTPLLVRYAALLEAKGAATFAAWLLAAWMDQDLQREKDPAVLKQIEQEARRDATLTAKFLKISEQQAFESLMRERLMPKGSAMAAKGCLAVVGACADGTTVATAIGYIKQWYGYRAGQCRALVRMLSWVEDPRATNEVLAIARRFRTRTIREEAEAAMADLATRRGWTVDELADRCVPDAGLDQRGALTLPFGAAALTLRLGRDLKPELLDGQGKRLKTVPTAGGSAEERAAAEAAWKDLKTELKGIIPQQRLRLYEAMCRRRTWPVAAWREFLLGHPILARLCQRLVWLGDGQLAFRPDADGSLVGADEGTVDLPPDATIRLAHALDCDEAQRTAWAGHLADHEIESLFDQFGRAPCVLPEGDAAGTVIADRLGWSMAYPALRSFMMGAGYARGPIDDGPAFSVWRRAWGGLDLYSEISFSGMAMPERDEVVGLGRLTFHRTGDDSAAIPLASLPPVLLAECWNDYHGAAALGAPSQHWQAELGS
jgi:hypothetical protein